jgi:hypothetical protein
MNLMLCIFKMNWVKIIEVGLRENLKCLVFWNVEG